MSFLRTVAVLRGSHAGAIIDLCTFRGNWHRKGNDLRFRV